MFEYNWKKDKSILRNLINIKGISKSTGIKLCALMGISPLTKYQDLSQNKLDQLNLLLSFYSKLTQPFNLNTTKDLLTQKDILYGKVLHNPILINLDKFVTQNIKTLIDSNTYKGFRHKLGYPVKGQRTRSNAKTAGRLNKRRIS